MLKRATFAGALGLISAVLLGSSPVAAASNGLKVAVLTNSCNSASSSYRPKA